MTVGDAWLTSLPFVVGLLLVPLGHSAETLVIRRVHQAVEGVNQRIDAEIPRHVSTDFISDYLRFGIGVSQYLGTSISFLAGLLAILWSVSGSVASLTAAFLLVILFVIRFLQLVSLEPIKYAARRRGKSIARANALGVGINAAGLAVVWLLCWRT